MITNTTVVHRIAAAFALAALVVSSLPFLAFAAENGPTVTITSSAASPNTSDNPIMFNVTVSEDVTDFAADDVSVSGGYVGSVSGSGMSYTVAVIPGDSDPNHPKVAGLVTVHINENQFGNNANQASNEIWRYFDPTASSTTPTDTTAPVVTITSGPSASSTSSTSSIMFAFTVDDASSTVRCSIVGQSEADSFFGCGSPQNYTLPDGAYRFTVDATDSSNNRGSKSVNFSVLMSTSTSTTTPGDTATTTATTTPPTETPPATSGGGGGGSPAPVSEGGAGSQPSGTPTGNAIIPTAPGGSVVPTGGNAVVPTAPQAEPVTPAPTTDTGSGAVNTVSPAPTVSQSTGGLAVVPTNSVSGSADESLNDDAATTPVEDTEDFGIPASSLGAAAATSDTGIPGWVWLVLGGLVLIGIGVWALRQPVVE